MTALRSKCPFCDSDPVKRSVTLAAHRHGSDKLSYNNPGTLVGCENPECLVRPSVAMLSEEEAVKAWETRT